MTPYLLNIKNTLFLLTGCFYILPIFADCSIEKSIFSNAVYQRIHLDYSPVASSAAQASINLFSPKINIVLNAYPNDADSLIIEFPDPIWSIEVKKNKKLDILLKNIKSDYEIINHDGKINLFSSEYDKNSTIPIRIIGERIESEEKENSFIFKAYIQIKIDLDRIYRSGYYYGKITSHIDCY